MTDVGKRQRPREIQPLDSVDQFLREQNLPYRRTQPDLIEIDATGGWADYHITLRAAPGSLTQLGRDRRIEIACAYTVRLPEIRASALSELVHLINGHLPIGHFELGAGRSPVFRYSVLANMLGDEPGLALANLVEQSISWCERYFSVFQAVSWSDLTPEEALTHVDFNIMDDT